MRAGVKSRRILIQLRFHCNCSPATLAHECGSDPCNGTVKHDGVCFSLPHNNAGARSAFAACAGSAHPPVHPSAARPPLTGTAFAIFVNCSNRSAQSRTLTSVITTPVFRVMDVTTPLSFTRRREILLGGGGGGATRRIEALCDASVARTCRERASANTA